MWEKHGICCDVRTLLQCTPGPSEFLHFSSSIARECSWTHPWLEGICPWTLCTPGQDDLPHVQCCSLRQLLQWRSPPSSLMHCGVWGKSSMYVATLTFYADVSINLMMRKFHFQFVTRALWTHSNSSQFLLRVPFLSLYGYTSSLHAFVLVLHEEQVTSFSQNL